MKVRGVHFNIKDITVSGKQGVKIELTSTCRVTTMSETSWVMILRYKKFEHPTYHEGFAARRIRKFTSQISSIFPWTPTREEACYLYKFNPRVHFELCLIPQKSIKSSSGN